MRRIFVILFAIFLFLGLLSPHAVSLVKSGEDLDLNLEMSKQVKEMYDTLIKEYVSTLEKEYNVSTEAESLLVKRIVKNYLVADLADYSLLLFMGKYNVATGGIEMKKANAQVIESLHKLSQSANDEMIENLNAIRALKGMAPVKKSRGAVEIY